MARPPDIQAIKRELETRIETLARQLCPGGKVHNGYYMPKNPRRNDRHPGSLWIRVRGSGLGVWQDHAVMSKPADVLELVREMVPCADMKEAYAWALDWLGWGGAGAPKIDEAERRRLAEADRRRREAEERRQERTAAEKANGAFAWWLSANAGLAGSPVETYLREARGIDLSRLAHPPGAIRWLAACDYHDGETGEVTSWPCMIAAMSDAAGRVRAVHRTYLARDGRGKAPVRSAKKIWPGFNGLVIRLAKGAGGRSPEEAARRGERSPLIVCEGIEDGLTLALAAPDMRVWACATLSNFGNLPAHACISRLIVAADNDWQTPQALKSFDKQRAGLARRFDDVRVIRAHVGKDANDVLNHQKGD